jgi:hypothetical protein
MLRPKTFLRVTPIAGAICLFFFSNGTRAIGSDQPIDEITGTWIGSFHQDSHDTQATFAMMMTVDEVTDQDFSGTIDWPENNNRTKIKGLVEGRLLKWTETEYVHGDDVVLGGLYVATFTDRRTISGTWMDPKHTIYPQGPRYGTPGGSFVLRKQ